MKWSFLSGEILFLAFIDEIEEYTNKLESHDAILLRVFNVYEKRELESYSTSAILHLWGFRQFLI